MPSRADDTFWAFDKYLLDESMNKFTLNSLDVCVCVCVSSRACAHVHACFIQVQFHPGFSQVLSRLSVHLLSGLDSTLAPLIKKKIFRLPKERDCSSFYLCCCCSFILHALYAIKTFMLSIVFPASC